MVEETIDFGVRNGSIPLSLCHCRIQTKTHTSRSEARVIWVVLSGDDSPPPCFSSAEQGPDRVGAIEIGDKRIFGLTTPRAGEAVWEFNSRSYGVASVIGTMQCSSGLKAEAPPYLLSLNNKKNNCRSLKWDNRIERRTPTHTTHVFGSFPSSDLAVTFLPNAPEPRFHISWPDPSRTPRNES